jgi:hypothetical protein
MNVQVKVEGSVLQPTHEVAIDGKILKGTTGVALRANKQMMNIVVWCDDTPDGQASAKLIKGAAPHLTLRRLPEKKLGRGEVLREAILERGTTKMSNFGKKIKSKLGIKMSLVRNPQPTQAPTVCSVYRRLQVKSSTSWAGKLATRAALKADPSALRRTGSGTAVAQAPAASSKVQSKPASQKTPVPNKAGKKTQ